MPAHLVDHGLDILVLAGLRSLLCEGYVLSATPEIYQRGQKPSQRLAKQVVEGRSQKRLLESPFDVQQKFNDVVQEPEKHRHTLLDAGSPAYRPFFVTDLPAHDTRCKTLN
jgi:hypothetical protein